MKPFVAILMGSDSDLTIMQHTADVLKQLDIHYEIKITSAHRTPDATHQYVVEADKRGCAVFIAGAGLSAALPGTVAAYTLKPVIGVPLEAGGLGGMDALLTVAQMPGGIPVACMAIGKHGAKNAGLFAAQILAQTDAKLAERVKQHRDQQAKGVYAKDAALRATS